MENIFFIDPQSYSNLAIYDYNLLINNNTFNISFFGNSLYSYKRITTVKFIPIFKYSRYNSEFIKLLSYLLSMIKLLIIILKVKPKIIHIEWIKIWAIDYYWLKLLKHLIDIKVIYTAHNILPHESGNSKYFLYKKYYSLVDKIISHTHISKEELKSLFALSEDKIVVIPHGVLNYDVDINYVGQLKKQFRNKFSLNEKICFAILGYQSTYKGADIVAKVWKDSLALQNASKYRLLILGKNNNVDFSLLKNIENVFIENRFFSDEEFLALLKIIDVLILPYRIISQSGVLMTAINESVPVIVSNVGGLPEPLTIADIGWNIGEANFINLRDQMLSIINNPSSIYQKKNNISEWDKVRKYYAWIGISEKTFTLYNRLISI